MSVAAAHVAVGPTGVIGRDLSAGAGDVRIDGRVGGDAALGSGDITVGSTAVIDGDVRYDRDATYVQEDGATVGGSVVAERSIATDIGLFVVPWWVGAVYGTLASLALGLVLVGAFPRTSRSIAEGVATEPLRSFGFGLATIIVVPVGLVVLALTIVGIPLTILGAVLFGFVAWMAMVWGRFAVAAYLLARVDVEDRWIAMTVGVVGFGVVAAVPVVGGLIDAVIALLGLGALTTTVLAARRGRREAVAEPEPLPDERGPRVA